MFGLVRNDDDSRTREGKGNKWSNCSVRTSVRIKLYVEGRLEAYRVVDEEQHFSSRLSGKHEP